MKYALRINIANKDRAVLENIGSKLPEYVIGKQYEEWGDNPELYSFLVFDTEEERAEMEQLIEDLEGVLNGSEVGSEIVLIEYRHDETPIKPCSIETIYEVVE